MLESLNGTRRIVQQLYYSVPEHHVSGRTTFALEPSLKIFHSDFVRDRWLQHFDLDGCQTSSDLTNPSVFS
jgi:hypothetical protein